MTYEKHPKSRISYLTFGVTFIYAGVFIISTTKDNMIQLELTGLYSRPYNSLIVTKLYPCDTK